MPIRALAEMTWDEVRDVDRRRAVVVLPVGALEAHGPHLPLATDVIIAEAMARECARRLDAEGDTVLLLPALWSTHAGFAAAFPGTVTVSPETVCSLVGDVAASLAEHGFLTLALANAHLDPGHLSSLRAAVASSPSGLTIAFVDLTRRAVAERLTEEFRTGACHAGRFEGSVVLAEAPGLVREDTARTLAPNPASLSTAIREGATTFREAGGEEAYFGWPADATADEGRETVRILGALLAEAVIAAREEG